MRGCLMLLTGLFLPFVGGCSHQDGATMAPPVRMAATAPEAGTSSAVSAVSEAGIGGSSEVVATPGAADAESGLQSFAGMKFQVPASWKSLPLSQMQMGIIAAKFGMPEISEDISLTLSATGGSLEDNVRRWEDQFSGGEPPVREVMAIGAEQATIVRLQGRFTPGFGRSPEENWSMTGVIIPMTGQNYYLKLTGPTADVARAEEEFLKFCQIARPE